MPRRSRECAKPEGFEALFGGHDGFMGFHGGSINGVFPTSWLVDFMFFLINMDDAAPSSGNPHIVCLPCLFVMTSVNSAIREDTTFASAQA